MNEQTIATISLFLPGLVCLMWAGILFFQRKNNTQKTILHLLCVGVLYYVAHALYISPSTNYKWMCALDIVSQPLTLALLGGIMSYIHTYNTKEPFSLSKKYIFFLPVIGHTIALWMIYSIIGFDEVVKFIQVYDLTMKAHPNDFILNVLPMQYNTQEFHLFYFIDNVLIRALCGIMFIALTCYDIYTLRHSGYRWGMIWRFLTKGGCITPIQIACLLVIALVIIESPLLIIGRVMISDMPLFGIIMSLLSSITIYIIAYCEMYSNATSHTLHELLHQSPYPGTQTTVSPEKQPEISTDHLKQPEVPSKQEKEKEKEVTVTPEAQLQRLFDTERIWMRHDLRITDLEGRLGMNRNKIAPLMQRVYGMPFRTLVVQRRLQYAMQRLITNPEWTDEAIATESGFSDRSTYYRRFKDYTGMTPREWLASQQK